MLFVDGNNLLYRSAFQAAKRFESKKPIFGPECIGRFLSTLRFIADRFLPFSLCVIWDGGHSERRTQLYENYKANRDRTTDSEVTKSRNADIANTTGILRNLGCRVISFPGKETDDIISFLARKTEHGLIISDDQDYLQLVNSNISVYLFSSDKYISRLNFKEFTGVEQSQFLLYKAVCGDKSDCILGVGGFGKKTAIKFFSKYSGIGDFNELLFTITELGKEGKLDKYDKTILEKANVIRKNLELVDTSRESFDADELVTLDNFGGANVVFNENIVFELKSLGLNTLTTNFTQWSGPFRRLV